MEKVKASVDTSWSLMTSGLAHVPPTPSAPKPTAPAASMAPPAVAHSTNPTWSEPSDGQIDATATLDQFVDTVDGVDSAILASVDGFAVARSNSMADEASQPAMLAAAVGLARQLVAMGGGNQLRQIVVDHDGGLLLVWPIGSERVLAVLASATVDQRSARSFVRARLTALDEATS